MPLQTLRAAPDIIARDHPLKIQPGYGTYSMPWQVQYQDAMRCCKGTPPNLKKTVPRMRPCVIGAGHLMADAYGFEVPL